ncbi:MAG: nucleotide exchange factor GrpE [Anaerolineae bacterium]|jgi:molecular chaperone GrpE
MPDKNATANEAEAKEEETKAEPLGETAEEIEDEVESEIEGLRRGLEEATEEAEEYLDGWRRAQAEFSNYKKRQRAEQAKLRELANASLMRKLLPVLDDFERAIVTMPDGIIKLSWSHGLLMMRRKLEAILESEGAVPIETDRGKFDPHFHEAVTHEEVRGFEEGQIIGEVQKGYVLGDRVLRPALVRVAKAPSESAEEEPEEAESKQDGE